VNLEHLPKDASARAEAAAVERGEPFQRIPPYTAFCFGLEGPDSVDLLSGDLALAMRESCGFDSPEAAAPYAAGWVGENGLLLPFDNIPGLYQAAFFEFITGRPTEYGPSTFVWMLPAVGEHVPVRKFPGNFDSP
jgi:hypothetical protein